MDCCICMIDVDKRKKGCIATVSRTGYTGVLCNKGRPNLTVNKTQ